MNDHLRHLVKRAPGIIHNQNGFISERVDSSDGMTLLKLQHVSPLEVGKWVQVRKGIYKGDVAYVTSTIGSGGVRLLLVPRLSQPQSSTGNFSHSRSAPTLFDCEAAKKLYNIEPVHIQKNIYSFRGDRFEHGLIIKSYASALVSATVSCMPFEIFCRFLESRHPALMSSRSSFLKPLEWHFAEGDEAYIVNNGESDKSGVVTALRSDAVELSTEEGIVSVPWLKIRKVIRQGDFVEVTGGMHLGSTGWVNELYMQMGSRRNSDDDNDYTWIFGQVANIIKIEDKETTLSDRTQVFPIPFRCSALVLIFLRYLMLASTY